MADSIIYLAGGKQVVDLGLDLVSQITVLNVCQKSCRSSTRDSVCGNNSGLSACGMSKLTNVLNG